MSSRLLELKVNWEKASNEPNYQHIVSAIPSDSSYDAQGSRAAYELLNTVDANTNSILLEFGSGPGRVTSHLSRYFGKIYAVDISRGMLQKLKQLNLSNVECIENNGLSLVGKISPVHCIYSDSVFIHNTKSDVFKIFREFNNCLVRNGVIAFQLPVYDSGREAESWIDVSIWTMREMQSLATNNGFIIEKIWKNPGKFSFNKVGIYHHKLHVFRKQ